MYVTVRCHSAVVRVKETAALFNKMSLCSSNSKKLGLHVTVRCHSAVITVKSGSCTLL